VRSDDLFPSFRLLKLLPKSEGFIAAVVHGFICYPLRVVLSRSCSYLICT
jgi:hypothetical protein